MNVVVSEETKRKSNPGTPGKAYHQRFVGEKSRHLTAFITPWALYEWTRIPFALINSQQAFATKFASLTWTMSLCRVKRLRNIWKICEQCLRKHGVKLRSSNYSLFQREVRYLNRIVNQAGHNIDPESTKAVTSLQKSVPNTVGEVRKLTGLLS